MPFPRSSGILLHVTSLPSRGGIGDLGPAAFRFLDFLHAGKQTLWQVLPLNPVGFGNSPYAATSAFAGNPLLISLEELAKRNWIAWERLDALLPDHGNVEFDAVQASKMPILHEACREFLKKPEAEKAGFHSFCEKNASWLEDYSLFATLRNRFQQASWNEWPREVARREPAVLQRLRQEHADAIAIEKVIQYAFYDQWQQLRLYAQERQIRMIGDVAIFVNYDSADVWTNPDLFYLDEDLKPVAVAGVPPDFFSATGQRWGNPLYRWDVLKKTHYAWWVQRMRWALATCDYVRLDHFRGFEAYWEIPASEETAVNGRWVPGPRSDLFHALKKELGELPFIAEDLGVITPEVDQLRKDLELPGMRVLQFGFSDRGAHNFLPHRYEPNTVVYTGTHDNDTTLGWWNTGASETEKHAVRTYFGLGEGPDGVVPALIRAAETSVAEFCVIVMQDVLGLDSSARMNVPSKADGNWAWRCAPDAFSPAIAAWLASLAEVCDREPEEISNLVISN